MAIRERDTIRNEMSDATRELASQPRRRQEVIEGFQAVALRNAVDESKEAGSVEELRQWSESTGALLGLLRRSTAEALDRVLEVLREHGDEPDDAVLEQWGRLQVHATYDRVRQESYTVGWLEDHGRSRQQLNQWRRRRRLFGIPDVPGVKGYAYPRWVFTDALRPKAWLPEILEAAEEARLDGLSLHLFMTNPEAGDERSPLEAAEAGDIGTAVKLVAAANAQGR